MSLQVGDDVVIVKSDEKYHLGVQAQVLEIHNGQIRIVLFTGKAVVYTDPACFRVIQTKEQRNAGPKTTRAVDRCYAI